MAEHRAAWSTAWGVVAVVSGAGAAALWVALTTGGSWWFLLPAVICSVIAAVGLYCMFAVLARWWPFNASDDAPEARAPAPASPPVSVTPTPTQADSRQAIFDKAPPELADMTRASLQELFAGRTAAQGKALMQQHVGKPVHILGEVEDVSFASAYGGSVRLRGRSGISFLLFFDADDKETERQLLIVLNTGDKLTVSGVINEIQANIVALDNCKLIDTPGRVS